MGTSILTRQDKPKTAGHGLDNCRSCAHRLCDFLDTEQRRRSISHLELGRGERLYLSDNQCMRFWIVMSGTAATCTNLEDGRRQIICLDSPGDLVCSMAAAVTAESWIEALVDCRICEINLDSAAIRLRNDARFLGMMFRLAHERLERSALQSVVLGRLDSLERLYLFLVERARRNGGKNVNDRGVRFHLPMSREDIADYLGLNAETVSRMLGRIKKSGLVQFMSPTDIVVPDLAALERRLPLQLETLKSSIPNLGANANLEGIGQR